MRPLDYGLLSKRESKASWRFRRFPNIFQGGNSTTDILYQKIIDTKKKETCKISSCGHKDDVGSNLKINRGYIYVFSINWLNNLKIHSMYSRWKIVVQCLRQVLEQKHLLHKGRRRTENRARIDKITDRITDK